MTNFHLKKKRAPKVINIGNTIAGKISVLLLKRVFLML